MLPQEHIRDTLIHKKYVLEASLRIINYLYSVERDEDALQLARKCARHDDSKLESDEMKEFLQLPSESVNMKKADAPLTSAVSSLIEKHWKHNRHHPEFFDDYHEMTELDIMEMVCDWYARSQQFQTDFRTFVLKRQEIRFKFDEDFFAQVWFYCDIIDKGEIAC